MERRYKLSPKQLAGLHEASVRVQRAQAELEAARRQAEGRLLLVLDALGVSEHTPGLRVEAGDLVYEADPDVEYLTEEQYQQELCTKVT